MKLFHTTYNPLDPTKPFGWWEFAVTLAQMLAWCLVVVEVVGLVLWCYIQLT